MSYEKSSLTRYLDGILQHNETLGNYRDGVSSSVVLMARYEAALRVPWPRDLDIHSRGNHSEYFRSGLWRYA